MRLLLRYAAYRLLAARIIRSFNSSSAAPDEGAGTETERSLYLHIPFCRRRCAFCNFYSEESSGERIRRYMEALNRELSWYAGSGRDLRRVFIGGGTPVTAGEELYALIGRIVSLWPGALVSTELAPWDLAPGTVRALAEAGCRRVSIGVQSFRSDLLEANGRSCPESGVLEEGLAECVATFPEVNIDMMYGFEGQGVSDIRRDAQRLLELGPQLITWYPLIGAKALSRSGFLRYREFHGAVGAGLAGRYRPVSAWSFRREDHGDSVDGEYLTSGEDFAGLGASAFGFAGGCFSVNRFSIDGYLAADRESPLDTAGPPVMFRKRFSPRMEERYRLLMALFGLDREVPRASAADRLLARLGGVAGGDGGFMVSLAMRELFRGVDRLRENMLKWER